MTQTHKELVNRISRLSVEKLNIAMTFINFLEQQKETEIFTETAAKDFGDASKSAKIPFSELKGICKVWMSDDFNEPLEELREYME